MPKSEDTQIVNAPRHPHIQIAVENFGPIEKAEIDLRPLTVFVGESNTGKTYLAALIYALHQIFEGFSLLPWLDFAGTHLNFTYRSQDHYQAEVQDKLDGEILEALEKLNTHGRPFKFSDLPERTRSFLRSNLEDSENFEDELKRCFDLESVSNLIRFTTSIGDELKLSLKICEENQILWSFNMHDTGSNPTTNGFISDDIVIKSNDRETLEKVLDFEDFVTLLRVPRKEKAESYYLPAARSGIMQSHGIIASSLVDRTTRVGLERFPEIPTFSGMIVDFLKQIIRYQEHRVSSREMSDIARALENEVLRGEIKVKRAVSGGYPEFLYRPQRAGQTLRMSRSSSMVSELAPFVLFLRSIVQPGDILIIEEPESHLHPRAQTQIVFTLARLVRVGVRVIVTTHSNWLLEQISNLVREGEVMERGKRQSEQVPWLTKEDIGAWLFRTDKPVQEIMFEDIAGIEPEEYGEVAEELYNRSVDLRSQLEDITGGTEGEPE